MNRRVLFLLIIASLATALVGQWIYAQGRSDHQLIKGVTDAKVTLQQGLTAAAQQGRPISAKFEVEDGKFQLSVYTAKGGDFTEVIVDPKTGAIAQAEKIKDSEDLNAAAKQKAAVDKATVSLLAATEKAVKAHPGDRAVSIFPETTAGHPTAEVTLMQGQTFKKVPEKLS